MPRCRTAGSWKGFVLTRMAHHLRYGTQGAKQGAANIFTALAVLFRNLVALTHGLAGIAECKERPDKKEEITSDVENGHIQWCLTVDEREFEQDYFHCDTVNKEGRQQHQYDLKGFAGSR